MNSAAPPLVEATATATQFRDDVLRGLSGRRKSLPSKYFYDRTGSELFDQICELPEYYPTRTELSIVRQFAHEMGDQIGRGVRLIEFGSGSSIKTRLLLDQLIDPVAYVPVDVSRQHLYSTAVQLQQDYPAVEILPVCADFTKPFRLPVTKRPTTHDAVYFPGSTIGNFERNEAKTLLRHIAKLCGRGGGLLIGIDLRKDAAVLEPAYNDASGVTAAFNLNLLKRANRELDANFDTESFQHLATYNEAEGRIEMYLESQVEQTVQIEDHCFDFTKGERICTEYSHKYTIEEFAEMAAEAGLTLRRQWLDEQQYFSVLHFALLDSATTQ